MPAAVVVCTFLGSLAACAAGGDLPPLPDPPGAATASGRPPESAADPGPGAGWQRVELPGSVRSITGLHSSNPPPHLYAAGVDAGESTLLDVTDGVASWFGVDLPGRYGEGLAAVASNGETVTVVEQADPRRRRPARLWLGDAFSGDHFAGEGDTDEDLPRDRRGRRPVWLSPLMDGEGSFRAVGAVPAGRSLWRLHAWEKWQLWEPLDTDHQLYVAGEPASRTVLTGTTETTVVVAGEVSDRPDGGRRPMVWSIVDTLEYSHGRWRSHRLVPSPDRITDVASWDLGWWVAGHRGLRPVVYDFDSRPGRPLRVPATRLDPEHPAVYVAGIPIGSPLVLATQSADGPALWVEGRRRGRWTRIPVPRGRLSAAETVGDGVYVVVDGRLWFRELRLPGS